MFCFKSRKLLNFSPSELICRHARFFQHTAIKEISSCHSTFLPGTTSRRAAVDIFLTWNAVLMLRETSCITLDILIVGQEVTFIICSMLGMPESLSASLIMSWLMKDWLSFMYFDRTWCHHTKYMKSYSCWKSWPMMYWWCWWVSVNHLWSSRMTWALSIFSSLQDTIGIIFCRLSFCDCSSLWKL